MSFLVLRDFDPLIVVHRHAPTNIVGMASVLGTIDRLLAEAVEQERRIALIYETSERRVVGGVPRRMARQWLEDRYGLLARGATSIGFVVASPLARGAAKAILWLRKPPVPTGLHETRAEAVSAALAHLREAGQRPPAALEELGDAAIGTRVARLLARP